MSVRVALGASRWRILRQIVIECGLVAGAGAAGGLLVGYLSARMLAVAMDLPPYLDFTPDLRLGLAALGAAALSMLAFGLVPAWSVSRRDLVRGIRDGGHQASSGLARARLQRVLIGVQVLGSCALLVVAGAMARGLQRVVAVDPGVTFDRAVVLAPSLERHGLSPEAAQDYWSRLVLALSSRPDIEGVALADSAPFSGAVNQSRYGASSGSLSIAVLHVEPRFFSLLGIPLVAGRTFEPADGPSAVIISRRLAETMYGGLEALGRGYPRDKPTRVIVGIAEDSMVARLRASNVAEEYAPIGPADLAHAVLVVQGRNAPERLLAPLYGAARLADPRIQPEVRVLAADYARHLRGPTLMGTIAALTAALVLLLACVGIFGMVAYGVKLRAKEIGIRRALGADTARVCATLVRQLTWPMALGMFAGTPVGILASRLLGGAPFHLAVADATASGSALALFALAASTAALLPAFRALNVDPLRALRQD
jgi:predicted permease